MDIYIKVILLLNKLFSLYAIIIIKLNLYQNVILG